MHAARQDGFQETAIPSVPGEARRLQDHIEAQLKQRRFEENEIFSVRLALEEALVNAIKHGNQMDPNKKVLVQYHIGQDRIDVRITDEGKGFDPDDVPDPLDPENLERPCGRGLLLIRHYMTEVEFQPPGNRLVMSKIFRSQPSRNGKAKKTG